MSDKPTIALMIHDLNPWGGQDRSMLEIAWQLNKEFPLQIHSFTLEGKDNWPAMEHIPYSARLTKPIIFKYLSYQKASAKNLKRLQPEVVQSTGTASRVSDVVQVQFIHHTWQKIAEQMPTDKDEGLSPLKSSYHKALSLYKKQMERDLYSKDKQYIAISHGIKKELMEHFDIPAENITIIYHGVDPQHFHPFQEQIVSQNKRKEIREKLSIAPRDFVLLHVGALNARKGLFQSIKVLSYLKKNGFDQVKFLAVGQGDQKLLEKLIEEHDVQEQVILAPHSRDIRHYYWAADCFFFPSFYEPFGLVILEAMACGLPVMTSSRAGGAELIHHGDNGLLFDPNQDCEEIANHLLPVLRDSGFARRLGENGRKTSLHHDWDQVGKQYRQFYKNYFLKKD